MLQLRVLIEIGYFSLLKLRIIVGLIRGRALLEVLRYSLFYIQAFIIQSHYNKILSYLLFLLRCLPLCCIIYLISC